MKPPKNPTKSKNKKHKNSKNKQTVSKIMDIDEDVPVKLQMSSSTSGFFSKPNEVGDIIRSQQTFLPVPDVQKMKPVNV